MLFIPILSFSQEKWSLQYCVDYAVEHNLQISAEKINLESHPEEIEFSTYQFLGLSEIRKMDFGFKNDVYHQALDYFSKIIEKN